MKLDTRRLPMAGGLMFVLLALVPMGMAFGGTPALADSCPNAAERFGASANLPDCRAYELVTQPVKEDNSNLFSSYGFPDGEHVVYDGLAPFPGAENGAVSPTLSWRTSTGWETRTLTPPQGPGEANTLYSPDQGDAMMSASFTSDFSTAFVASTFASDPLDQNKNLDVYRINTASGAGTLASLPDSGPMTEGIYKPPGTFAGYLPGSFLAGASADGSRVFFTDLMGIPVAPGTPAASKPVGFEVYERRDEHTYLVGVLPDGSVPNCGAEVGEGGLNNIDYYSHYIYGAISPDGSNVVFHTPAEDNPEEKIPGCNPNSTYPYGEGALYIRENNGTPQARTVKLSGIVYLGRSADGTKIFSGGDLEGNAEGGPLYEYDIPTEQTVKIGTGSFLTASADGSVVYYLMDPNPYGGRAGGPSQRLMVYDKGVTKEVSGAGPGYAGKTMENSVNLLGVLVRENLPVASSDGSKLLFLERGNLTAYNSAGPACKALNELSGSIYLPQYCAEAYIYDLANGSFTCVSCSPDGTPPSGGTELFIPPGYNVMTPQTTYSLSEDGSRAYFETANALVPQDTNGQTDVYEWEGGHIYLLSSGQGSQGSRLDGASRNGNDVIIQTSDQLAPQDVESSTQIYDARVDGGFPYTQPVYGCESGQCQGPQTPAPAFSAPASATFVGVGNPATQSVASTPKSKKPKAKKPKRKAKPKGKRRHAPKAGGRGSRNRNRRGRK